MASRTIAIRITVDNREAINAAQAQVIAIRAMNDETYKGTQLQNGLTSSFLKGNIAARAISIAFLSIRDSLKAAASEAIAFEYTMAKFNTITDAGAVVTGAVSKSIASLAESTKQSQTELAKTALEMSKMGLSASQVVQALGGVSKLARALDEDLVRTGETVVGVLNTYGLSADQANKVTNEIAFTVKASALSMETFGTAFSYVGGTAKAAGISIEELQGAMGVLSNAGIKSSTIGTQLRKIIANLSDEHSKASKVIGGTIQTYGSLEKALDVLADKHLSVSDLTQLFGRTASSVSDILIRYRDAMGQFAKQTAATEDITSKMGEDLNTTFKSALDSVAVAWKQIGIEALASTGYMRDGLNLTSKILNNIADRVALENQLDKYKKEDRGAYQMGVLQHGSSDNAFAEDPNFQAWQNLVKQREATALRVDNIIDELKNTLGGDKAKLSQAETNVQAMPIENTFLFKKLAEEYAGAGHSKAEFLQKLQMAREKKVLEISGINVDGADDKDTIYGSDKPKETKAQKRSHKASAFMLAYEGMVAPLSDANQTVEGKKSNPVKDNLITEKDLAGTIAYNKYLTEASEKTMAFAANTVAMKMSIESVNGSVDILSHYFIEGIFSDKKDPFKNISDAFGDFAKKMAADLVALSLKILFFKGLLAALGGGVGFGFVGSLASAVVPGVKFASGTDQVVDRPTMFMAGESGKERVTVTPRAKMSSGGGGGGITVVIQGDVMDGAKFTEAVEMAQKKLNRRNV